MPRFLPSSHQMRSQAITLTHVHSLNSIRPTATQTHTKHRHSYCEIEERTILIKMIICTLMKICLSPVLARGLPLSLCSAALPLSAWVPETITQ